MSSNLWLSNSTHRVFGWKELLEEWDASLQTPSQVTRVFENLKAATDPNSEHEPRLSQFLNYLNYEQEGLVWFLYECISMRWMYGSVRVDYVRSLVDEIENLDGYFPRFPSSPQGKTVRQFVQDNLETNELAEVQMMPQLVQHQPLYTPTRSVRADYSYAQRAPLRRMPAFTPFSADAQFVPTDVPQVHRTLSQQFEAVQPKKEHIELRFIRNKKSVEDDVMKICHVSEDSYNILYRDKQSGTNSKMLAVTRSAVINFLRLSLRLLTVDDEPFETVQLTFPCMPSVLVSTKELTSQTRDLIYDSVEATMDFWPVSA